jgi:hypothetical protein
MSYFDISQRKKTINLNSKYEREITDKKDEYDSHLTVLGKQHKNKKKPLNKLLMFQLQNRMTSREFCNSLRSTMKSRFKSQ